MSDVFVVVNEGWDEKETILHPSIFGPFDSEDSARAFIGQHPRFNPKSGVFEPSNGGYAGIHLVSRSTAESPQNAIDFWKEDE